MVKSYAAVAFVVALCSVFLIACDADQGDGGSLQPDTTTTPALIAVATATATLIPEPPTPTPYTPTGKGTPIPPVYEPITADSASAITLIAKWDVGFQADTNLSFSADSSLISMGLRRWRVADGFLASREESAPQDIQLAPQPGGTSLDGRYSVKVNEWRYLVISNLEDPTTGLDYSLNASQAYFYPDGENLILTFHNGEIWLVNFASLERHLLALEPYHTYYDSELQPDLVFDTGVKSAPTSIAVSADGAYLAFGFKDQRIQIRQVSDLGLVSTLDNPSQPTCLAFSYDNHLLAVASADLLIRVWDLQTGQIVAELEGSQEPIKGLSFAPNGRMLASANFNWIYLWGILPNTGYEAAQGTATSLTGVNPTATHTPASLPLPTSTPTISLPAYEDHLPLAWPVALPPQQQIEEARSCDVHYLAIWRYPAGLHYWQLQAAYTPESACDWAALAAAYIDHTQNQEVIPEEGKRAFAQTILLNPAYAFSETLFYPYFSSLALVEPPPFSNQPITSLVIDYHWSGMGEPARVAYRIDIRNAHLTDELQVSIEGQPDDMVAQAKGTIRATLVQSVSSALVDFFPIQAPGEFALCTDNDPQWLVEITYLDGTQLTLDTAHSNMLNCGGPWQTRIDDQIYLQYSTALIMKMGEIFDSLNLAFGQPYAMYCDSVDPFSLVYP